MDSAQVLKLTLHGHLVGYVVAYQSGRRVLSFAPPFVRDIQRPTLTLTTHPTFPRSAELLERPWVTNRRIHPLLANLLPEGEQREWLARRLKVHPEDDFPLLAHLGRDLPGALIVEPVPPEQVPPWALTEHIQVEAMAMEPPAGRHGFSLAGVQMKFSMAERSGRYRFSAFGGSGHWIVKPPSARHWQVPANEYTAMQLAAQAGVDIPTVRLVDRQNLDDLPPINLPDEPLAYAIQRFDRTDAGRVHTEDFAQILVKYPHEKYGAANYEQMAKILYRYSGDGLADVQQLARRLLVNILLANGDAHLKNWSLIYPDGRTPRLAPAYDIVTTAAYIEGEREQALNLGKSKDWYRIDFEHFERWARHADIPWRAIKPHLKDVLDKARTRWPAHLAELPMAADHKKLLTEHWKALTPDFRL